MGILRCHGRFLNANIGENAKYHILLPGNKCFTHLLITEVHEHLIHAGVSHKYGKNIGSVKLKQCSVTLDLSET